MNIEHINKVIEDIRDEANFFNMNSFTDNVGVGGSGETCGTPGCIGGWAGFERRIACGLNPATMTSMDWYDLASNAETYGQDYLDLSRDQALTLFYPELDYGSVEYARITRQQAIQTLEHLRDTGEVSWEHLRGTPAFIEYDEYD